MVNETSVGGYLNYMQGVLPIGFNSKDVMATYAAEKALVLDPAALVARLNLLLCANQLNDGHAGAHRQRAGNAGADRGEQRDAQAQPRLRRRAAGDGFAPNT